MLRHKSTPNQWTAILDTLKYEEIGKNRNGYVKADVCHQIYKTEPPMQTSVTDYGTECIGDVVRSSKLHWFVHVERTPQEDQLKKTMLKVNDCEVDLGRH